MTISKLYPPMISCYEEVSRFQNECIEKKIFGMGWNVTNFLPSGKADECGIIKFGSRIDMYLPLDAEVKVKIGDYVRACETVIAELHK